MNDKNTVTSIINPYLVNNELSGISLKDLRDRIDNLLKGGVIITCNNNENDQVAFTTTYRIKSGKFKDIYLLRKVQIGSKMLDPDQYILKVRYSENSTAYQENEQMNIPDQGTIPVEMSEGKRYSLLPGEIKQYFASVVSTNNNILLTTSQYIVDFLVQEKMKTSLHVLRANFPLNTSQVFAIMHELFKIAKDLDSHGYAFTNFSPTSVMLDVRNNKILLKLMNPTFIQRQDMILVGNNDKLLSTASIDQLTGRNMSNLSNMLWNIIFTGFDILRQKSYIEDIKKCCVDDDYDCIRHQLIENRTREIEEMGRNSVFNQLISLVPDVNAMIEATRSYATDIMSVRDYVIKLAAKKLLFDYAAAPYESTLNRYRGKCRNIDQASYSGINELMNTSLNTSDNSASSTSSAWPSLRPILSDNTSSTLSSRPSAISSGTSSNRLSRRLSDKLNGSMSAIGPGSSMSSIGSGSSTSTGSTSSTSSVWPSLRPILSDNTSSTLSSRPPSSYSGINELMNTSLNTFPSAISSGTSSNRLSRRLSDKLSDKLNGSAIGPGSSTSTGSTWPSLRPILSNDASSTLSSRPPSSYSGINELMNTSGNTSGPLSSKLSDRLSSNTSSLNQSSDTFDEINIPTRSRAGFAPRSTVPRSTSFASRRGGARLNNMFSPLSGIPSTSTRPLQTVFGGADTRDILHQLDARIRDLEGRIRSSRQAQ